MSMPYHGSRILNIGKRTTRLSVHRSLHSIFQLPDTRDERGVVLVWAMLILMGLFATAAVVSVIMNSSLRIAGSIDASLPAFYAAESCAEQAQFYVLKVDDPSGVGGALLTKSEKVSKLNSPSAPAPSLTGGLLNASTWSRFADAVCIASQPPSPPDPCEQVFLRCVGSFQGTKSGVSSLF